MSGPITQIAVVGDGLAAWTTAAILARRLPGVAIFAVPAAGRQGIGDLYATLPPGRARLLDAIGISDRDLIAHARGVFRFGVRFAKWRNDAASFTIGLGGLGSGIGGASFDGLWARAARGGHGPPGSQESPPMPIEAWSPGAMLANSNRFAPPSEDSEHPFGELAVAMAVDSGAYRALLQHAALAAGVRSTAALLEISTAGEHITSLRLDDGSSLAADLYVDASGPDARLMNALPGGSDRTDWSPWLTADRVAFADAAADPALPPIDVFVARPACWTMIAPLVERTIVAQVYESRRLRAPVGLKPIVVAQGRRRHSWIGNCVAIGDAAVEIEPLMVPHLALVHSAVERLVTLMPGADCAKVETSHYDREWREESDHLRDMLVLAHAVSGRREPYWRTGTKLSEPIGSILSLWRERGFLPVRDREMWAREQRIQLLLGSGILPEGSEPIADAVSEHVFNHIAEQRRLAIVNAVNSAPRHSEIIAHFRRTLGA